MLLRRVANTAPLASIRAVLLPLLMLLLLPLLLGTTLTALTPAICVQREVARSLNVLHAWLVRADHIRPDCLHLGVLLRG